MFGDGERNARFSAAMASSNVMSNLILSSDCRETWQYKQLCSHRSVTTKMCNAYKPASTEYHLLPFRFTELNDDHYVLSNIAGEFITLPREILPTLINHQ